MHSNNSSSVAAPTALLGSHGSLDASLTPHCVPAGGSMDATPAAVTASALMHPAFKIFQADRRTMLAPATSGPEVFIFPNLRNLYDTMAEELRLKGTTICLGRPVDSLHFVGQHGSTSDRWEAATAAWPPASNTSTDLQTACGGRWRQM